MRTLLISLVVLLVALLAGCGGGGGGGGSIVGPTISNIQVFPQGLGFTGGTVQVTADVTSSRAITSVQVQAIGPTTITSPMTQTTGATYVGTVQLPANNGSANVTYQIKVLAEDAGGGKSSATSSSSVVVSSPDNPPPPPL